MEVRFRWGFFHACICVLPSTLISVSGILSLHIGLLGRMYSTLIANQQKPDWNVMLINTPNPLHIPVDAKSTVVCSISYGSQTQSWTRWRYSGQSILGWKFLWSLLRAWLRIDYASLFAIESEFSPFHHDVSYQLIEMEDKQHEPYQHPKTLQRTWNYAICSCRDPKSLNAFRFRL